MLYDGLVPEHVWWGGRMFGVGGSFSLRLGMVEYYDSLNDELIPWVKNISAVEAKHFFVVIVDWKSVCYYIWDSLALMSPKNKEMSARFHSTLPNAFDWWCDAYVGDSSGISIKYNTWFNYFWRKKKGLAVLPPSLVFALQKPEASPH